jgi:hypothetical protein
MNILGITVFAALILLPLFGIALLIARLRGAPTIWNRQLWKPYIITVFLLVGVVLICAFLCGVVGSFLPGVD